VLALTGKCIHWVRLRQYVCANNDPVHHGCRDDVLSPIGPDFTMRTGYVNYANLLLVDRSTLEEVRELVRRGSMAPNTAAKIIASRVRPP
jgi:hypothetical protein